MSEYLATTVRCCKRARHFLHVPRDWTRPPVGNLVRAYCLNPRCRNHHGVNFVGPDKIIDA